MPVEIGSDRSRLQSQSGSTRASVFIVERPADRLEVKPLVDKEYGDFNRLERRINDG
jgi:hypothetical protein